MAQLDDRGRGRTQAAGGPRATGWRHGDYLDTRARAPRPAPVPRPPGHVLAGLAAAVATCALGFGVLYLTWQRVAATIVVHEQVTFLSSGIPAGLALVLLGTVGLSMAARRGWRHRLARRPFLLDILGGLLVVAGLIVIGIGWRDVAATGLVHDQLSYLASTAPTGFGLVVLGAGLVSIATDTAPAASRD